MNTMMWGVDSGSVDEKRLKPLGLICYGGSSNDKGEMTWHVSDKKGFDVYLVRKDFDNVEEVYKKYKKDLRKDKLNRINDSIQAEI
jgi:hypothetical protein